MIPRLLQDIRLTFRHAAKAPAFSTVVILTLAIGIGANTSIFSVADALLLRPLPYPDAARLVQIDSARTNNAQRSPVSWPRASQIIERNRSFSAIAAYTSEVFNLTGRGDPEQVPAERVSWNFFEVLGIRPELGRTFRPEEDKAGGDFAAIITHAFWQRMFAADPAAVGSHLSLDGKDFTIAGVLPASYQAAFFGRTAEIYVPRVFELNMVTPEQVRSGVGFLNCVARLRPGVTLKQAQAEIDGLGVDYRREFPQAPDSDMTIRTHAGNLRDEVVSGSREAVLILFGAVAVVLLIACANVGSLLLSRALGRRREVAIRTAMGATRREIVRQLLTESVTLALIGGAFGAALSAWGTQILAAMAEGSLPRASEIRTDGWALVFTAAISVLAGVLFGLAPALQTARGDSIGILRSESRGSTSGRRRNLLRSVLVIFQVALSLVLLVGAGLLLRNFLQLRESGRNFDTRDVLTMHVALPPARYPKGPQMIAFYDALLARVRALPGVRSTSITSALPANPVRFSPALPEGQPAVPLMQRPFFNITTLSPGFSDTLKLPLLAGRMFDEHDDATARRVILINEATARRFWPRENAVGKRILVGRQVQPTEIVGVLADLPNTSLGSDVQPEIYMPFDQLPWPGMNLLIRTAGDPHQYAGAARAAVFATDKDQPVIAVKTMDEVLESAAAQPRFTTTLLATLAGAALILAIIGIYSVISYSVAERTQEIGIRSALGAARGDILTLVLRQGLGLAAAGIGLGLLGSIAATRLLATLLYHVSATDPVTFTAAALLFAAVAAVATYIPAQRAVHFDPIVALRYE